MTARGVAVFDTAIGTCGIAWGPHGITGVQFPERSAESTRARLGGEPSQFDPPAR